MSIKVELIDDDKYYKVTIQPEDEALYVLDTTFGTSIFNEYGECYDIESGQWFNFAIQDCEVIKKTKVEKTTQLILPTDRELEEENNGVRVYVQGIDWVDGEFEFKPMQHKTVSREHVGDEIIEKLQAGTIIIITSEGKSAVMHKDYGYITAFLKGLTMADIFKTSFGL